jgi:hypothetical protein
MQQPRAVEFLEMERRGCRRGADRLGDFTGGQSGRALANEQAKDRKALRVSEGGKGCDGRF